MIVLKLVFFKDDKNFLNFEKDQSLIIYDEIYKDVYRAKNYEGVVGLVHQNLIELYNDGKFFSYFSKHK